MVVRPLFRGCIVTVLGPSGSVSPSQEGTGRGGFQDASCCRVRWIVGLPFHIFKSALFPSAPSI